MNSTNPYESPAPCPTIEIPARQRALNLIRWPALVLMCFSAIQVVGFSIGAVILFSMIAVTAARPNSMVRAFLPLSTILTCGFIYFGAWKMRSLRSLTLCRVAAAMACIPYATPFVWFGIPFGIWAIVVLFRTAAEFDQPDLLSEVTSK